MSDAVDPETWARVLDAIDADAPPALEVADALASATGIAESDAYDRVTDAIDDGVLREEGEGFGGIRLGDAETSESSKPDESGREEAGTSTATPGLEAGEPAEEAPVDRWAAADFATVDPQTWAPAQVEREAWMCRKDSKAPYAPWADADAPVECSHTDHDEATTCDKCTHDAGYKWGSDGSREHVHGDHDTARKWADMDPSLSSDLVYIQREADPFAFVDGDDVRDPDTGEIHPAFEAILGHLGVTYADVSTSGGGVHAVYRGEIPLDGVPEAKFTIDSEPWGANDDAPAVEIYDGKHVCIATGDHIVGTGTEIVEWDDDALADILRANGYEERPEPSADSSVELNGYEPKATGSDETTDDIRDVFKALDRLDPKNVGEKTIVREWTRGRRSFLPTWGSASDNGTANYIDGQIWHDTGHDGGYGGPAVMAAIDARLISHRGAEPSDVSGETFFKALDHLRALGFSIPRLENTYEEDNESDPEAYRQDPRDLGATVDPQRAWDAAGRVTPQDLPDDRLKATDDGEAFAAPSGDPVDVVRAVALETGLVDDVGAPLRDDYPEAYRRARDEFGAPLPEYYTTADAIAEFDAVLDVIGEVTFWDLDTAALGSEITETGDEVGGDAVRALNPAWRESDSEASVLVFDSGTVWDADTESTLDALRFVALDSGLIDAPETLLEGERFTEAYRRARETYGAPLPRWHPAGDGDRDITPQLPASEELLEAADLDGVDRSALETARRDVETLLGEAVDDTGSPTVVTALPATGKTTGTVKTARERPLSYLAPRKELQAQALEKADRWGVDAEICPVFAEERVRDDVLTAAVGHVREHGKSRLRDRWAILDAAFDGLDEDDAPDLGEIFVEEDDESVDLDRPTCETAEGEHGVAWALAVHVARRLGYTPQEIHTQARGLFGAPLPCSHGEGCRYSNGWEALADPDDTADLLVGSYVHAHVESVRTAYDRAPDGDITKRPRAVVVDEFIGEAFTREFGAEALDHATWLATCLRDDIVDRRDMYRADLEADEWVEAWLAGTGDDVDAVADVIDALARTGSLLDAREAAREIRAEVDSGRLETVGIDEALATLAESATDPTEAYADLRTALDALPVDHPARGIARWVEDDVVDPLAKATRSGAGEPTVDGVTVAGRPFGGDLAAIVENAVDAVREGDDGTREAIAAATTALRGGAEGCRRLAAWADDGYAHPDAHHLLEGVITPTDGDSDADARRIHTDCWAFDPDATDGTTLDVVETTERARTVIDRNDHGALLHTPPSRQAGNGDEVALVGLDATGRRELWANALGEDVTLADIHDTDAERAAFLREALDLRVLRAADRPRPYEGDPTTKDTDGDVALLEAIADEYAGIDAPRQQGEAPEAVGNPAAITTKGVRSLLEDDPRLNDIVAEWENYGNVKGANDLGSHRLAAILGSQHYGDHAIERFCAIAGREVDTAREGGRGATLEYGDPLADAYLNHMREDQTMQAILRFARGDSGATVVARTSALREDLPVVGEGQVVETWSDTATAIAREYRRLGDEFTAADVRDVVDVGSRQVRRILAELVEAGYLRRSDPGVGRANTYEPVDTPGAGEVDLPAREEAVAPGRSASNQYYTGNVRVWGGDPPLERRAPGGSARTIRAPSAPAVATAGNGGDPGDHDPE